MIVVPYSSRKCQIESYVSTFRVPERGAIWAGQNDLLPKFSKKLDKGCGTNVGRAN